MDKIDVLIIGGGLAGLSAAVTLCSKSDLSVMLVEKEHVGSNRTTPAVFLDTVNEFELHDSILENYSGFIFQSPLGACARYDFGMPVLAGLDYRKACNILYKRAVVNGLVGTTGGALDFTPAVPDAGQPIVVNLSSGDKIRTEVLIDASGHAQWAANLLHINRSRYYSHCFGELLTGCAFPERSSFRFLGPVHRYGNGGGWFYPAGYTSASMGYSRVVATAHQDAEELRAGYEFAKKEFRPYAEWVREGVRERVERGVVPVGRIGRFSADRVLIIGDAAGQAHPWVVEGCRPALNNGRLCANVVLSAFAKERFDQSYLSSYERQWNRVNRERFWRTASVAELVWNRSDDASNAAIESLSRLSPEQLLFFMRDNPASLFHKAYAVAGYMRRGVVKWLSSAIGRTR